MADSDESLDVTSEQFDPLKALYSERVVLPFPQVQPLDNLDKYASAARGKSTKKSVKTEDEQRPSTSAGLSSVRRFLPHQEPVRAPQREPRTVLTRMKQAVGPLSLMKRWMEKRRKIKVWTRGATGIRGVAAGFLAAFDKHWNLALHDVDELFRRPVKLKVPVLGDVANISLADSQTVPEGIAGESGNLRVGESGVPEVKVRRGEVLVHRSRRFIILRRHVGQLLVRGEQIVLVAEEGHVGHPITVHCDDLLRTQS